MKTDINLLRLKLIRLRYMALVPYIIIALILILTVTPIYLKGTLTNRLKSLDKKLDNSFFIEDAYQDLDFQYQELTNIRKLQEWVDTKWDYLDRVFEIIECSNLSDMEIMQIVMTDDMISIHGILDAEISTVDYINNIKSIKDVINVNIREINLDKENMTKTISLDCIIGTINSDFNDVFSDYLDFEETDL